MKSIYILLFSFLALIGTNVSIAQCDVPTFGTPTSSAYTVSVNWSTPSNVSYYSIRYREVGSPTWSTVTANALTTSRTTSNLSPTTQYEFQIQNHCTGGLGVSGFSPSLTIFTTSLSSCELPPVFTASSLTSNSATVTWPAVAGAAWYEFRYRQVGSPSWISLGTLGTLSKFIGGLSPNTQYEFQGRSYCNVDVRSLWSNSLLFSTSVTPPSLSTTIINANNATISWPSVSGALWYEFRYKPSSSGTWISAGTLSPSYNNKVLTGLVPSTSYNFQGRTFGPGGQPSEWSNTLNFTTVVAQNCQLPPAIVASNVFGTNATITWPAVNLAAWYEFQYQITGSGSWISLGTLGSSSTSRVISGLQQLTSYTIRARTYCSNGIPSSWSSIVITTSELTGCEIPPFIYLSASTDTSATISWDQVSGAAWLEFRYKETSSPTWLTLGTLPGNATSKTFQGFIAGKTYDFEARSFCPNAIGSSWMSIQFPIGGVEAPLEPANDADVAIKSISEEINETIIIYPNPANDILHIKTNISELNSLIKVNIIDMSGRIVSETLMVCAEGENITTVDVSNLISGIYNLEIFNNNSLVNRSRIRKN